MIKLYLAGPIDKDPSLGKSSRQEVRQVLRGLPIDFVDPVEFDYNKSLEPLSKFFQNESHSFEECVAHARTVSEGDVEALLDCDGVIAIVNKYVGTGTPAECTIAKYRNLDGRYEPIPVFGLIQDPWRQMKPWIMGNIDSFSFSLQELRAKLIEFYGLK